MWRRLVVCFGLAFAFGIVAPPSPAHDLVGRESDEEHDPEGREVDGWAGVRGDGNRWGDSGHRVCVRASGASRRLGRARLLADGVAPVLMRRRGGGWRASRRRQPPRRRERARARRGRGGGGWWRGLRGGAAPAPARGGGRGRG